MSARESHRDRCAAQRSSRSGFLYQKRIDHFFFFCFPPGSFSYILCFFFSPSSLSLWLLSLCLSAVAGIYWSLWLLTTTTRSSHQIDFLPSRVSPTQQHGMEDFENRGLSFMFGKESLSGAHPIFSGQRRVEAATFSIIDRVSPQMATF